MNDLVLTLHDGWGFLNHLSFPSGMKFLNLDEWCWHSNGSHPYCGMWFTRTDNTTKRYMGNMVIEEEEWKYSGHILDLDKRTEMNMTLWKVSNVVGEKQYVIAHKEAGAAYVSELPILDTSTGKVETLTVEAIVSFQEPQFNPRKVTDKEVERIQNKWI